VREGRFGGKVAALTARQLCHTFFFPKKTFNRLASDLASVHINQPGST
jgi:hypothetical protein